MEYELYTIYDAVTHTYTPPMAQDNDAAAMRAFRHECINPATTWNSSPQDYFLYKVGIWNSNTGDIVSHSPERVCAATDFVRKEK